MASLMQWMNEVAGDSTKIFGHFVPNRLPARPTRLQLFACLIKMSGGGWGISQGGGLYGWTGLQQDTALLHLELANFVSGWLEGTDNAEALVLQDALDAEWDRVARLAEAEEA